MIKLVLFFASVFSLSAQNGLFVESEPYGAFVRVGETLLEGRTPLLIRRLPPGKVKVTVFRDGYKAAEQEVDILAEGFPVVSLKLERETIPLAFPEEESFFLLTKDQMGQGAQYRLENGGYQLRLVDGKVRLEPIFPDEGQLIVASWILPLTLSASAALTIRDINAPWIPTFPVSPTTLTSYAFSVFNLGWYLALASRENQFRNSLLAIPEPVSGVSEPPGLLFQKGQRSLDEGNIDLARAILLQVFEESPESPWAAQSLFLLSRIALVKGQVNQALALYSNLVQIYPVRDLYDRSVKVLADLFYDQGNTVEARKWFDLITYSDGFITREDTATLKAQLEAP